MLHAKGWLAVSATALAFGGANMAAPVDAAVKAPKYSSPQPFTQKEKDEGAKAHTEILAEFGGAMTGTQADYVRRVGQKIAVQSKLGNAQTDFNVSLLNSSVNNAFALPGGFVYITRQLTALCNSEAEMAGVLGHEVGHTAARHSAQRQKNSTIAQIFGIGGSILGAVLGDNGGILGALGNGLKQYSGTVAQLFTLKYSRGQEEEADDLGIRYLSAAGYDPSALSSMLNSLAMQTSVDAKVAGMSGSALPEWASTHPDPAKRVVRALTNAKPYPVSTVRNADAHFAAINGMMYDDDPAQGVIEGREFLHRDLKLKFAVPEGFGLQNGAQAVSINGNSGQGIFGQGNLTGDRRAYIDAVFKSATGSEKSANFGEVKQTTINGIPAFYATAQVSGQQGTSEVTVFAYEFATGQTFHFLTVTKAGVAPFSAMFQSMARLSASEAAAIKARKIKVVTVAKADTIASLSAKMAYANYQQDRFLALNGLSSTAKLATGQKVKIVTY